MRGKLIDLSSALKYYGMKVSIADVLECAKPLSIFKSPSEKDKENIRMILLACLLKKEEDISVFNEQFEKWWFRWFGSITEITFDWNGLKSDLHKAIYKGNRDAIETLIQRAVEKAKQNGLEETLFGAEGSVGKNDGSANNGKAFGQKTPLSNRDLYDRLRNMLELDKIRDDIDRNENMGIWHQTNAKNSLKKAEAALRKIIFNPQLKGESMRKIRLAEMDQQDVADISIANATFVQLKKMEEIVPEIVRKLSHRRKYIKDPHRGVLQFRKTMRNSLKNGGIPIEIVFKRKAPKRERIALLCDLSLSVEMFSVFSLHLAHCFSSQFAGVRCFGFISDIDDITLHVSRSDFPKSLSSLYKESKLVSYTSNSDYGNVLKSFVNKYLPDMGYSTTVLIVGDARNNGRNPQASELKTIRSQVKEIHWLNPEPKYRWNTGDSIMHVYEKYCDSVSHIRTVNDLAIFLANLRK